MIIRKFRPDDLDVLLELFYDVVHSIGAKYYNDDQVRAWAPKKGYNREKWLKSLTTNISYVIEEKGEIIGFGDMTHEGYLDHLFVHQAHQGKGIASTIFRELEKEAKKLKLKELSTEASLPLKPIAEKWGFKVIKKQQKLLRGVELTNYKMRKKLV